MTIPERPRLRPVESFPHMGPNGEVLFVLRDPQGFSEPIVIPYPAAVAASLMDGMRELQELHEDCQRRLGQQVARTDLEGLVGALEDRYFLDSDRFRARWKQEIERYLNSPTRPAAHAGSAYPVEPQPLREQFDNMFADEQGPGAPNLGSPPPNGRLHGVMSPHIDIRRGGPTIAWAYKRLVEESDADLFVIFGTAHNPMSSPVSISKKDFETPLGTVETDRKFIAALSARLARMPEGRELRLFSDELAHRYEHSIEFQVVWLQHLLGGRRAFKIVPVLVGSFHEFIAKGIRPSTSPMLNAFIAALRETAAERAGRVCYISSADLAHIGQRYGDRDLLDRARLEQQSADDRQLLEATCRADAAGLFDAVTAQQDRNRICGLSPTYLMLDVVQAARGEMLKYTQAVEGDGTSCVSFASMAFYGND